MLPAHRLTLTVAAAAIAGCASTGDLMNKAPDLFVTSKKPAREFASCVSGSWGQHAANVNLGLLPNGYTVAITNPYAGGADAVAKITDVSTGSQVTYAARAPSLSPAWMMEGVTACI